MTRTFEINDATREQVPLLVGLVGPSSSGKTYSALRLATGMQKVSGGDIVCIDTESKRALHYASNFQFKHMPFGAPFGPLDYLAAVEAAVKAGAGVVIIDSASHEWEGPGGVLESHDAKAQELAKKWKTSLDKVKLTAWAEPKTHHRRLINTVLQLPVHTIWCFRAKEKLKIEKGKDPKPLGWMPIAGDDLIYEMTVNALLPPGAEGVAEWSPDQEGSRQVVKLPGWARDLFKGGKPFDESHGEALAKWAAGDAPSEDDRAKKARAWVDDKLADAESEADLDKVYKGIQRAPASIQKELMDKLETRRRELQGEAEEPPPFEEETA